MIEFVKKLLDFWGHCVNVQEDKRG